ncbi:MAG: T9SS type A sorting domain-containing protein [Saprospiraceae bacterium]|nr:T9SS type A sorting domain-containing protein [Saprospiraceae bacterium]
MSHSLIPPILRLLAISMFVLNTALQTSGQNACDDDAMPPVIVCQGLQFMLPLSGSRLITPEDVILSVDDNCAIDPNSILIIPNNFSGPVTVSANVSVRDVSGNQASCIANVTALGRPTTLVNDGVFQATENDTVSLQATLVDDVTGGPAPGVFIAFMIGTQQVYAQTASDGIATTQIVLNQSPGNYTLSTMTDGGAAIFLNSSDSDPFIIDPMDSDGDGVADDDDNCPLTANADQADAEGDDIGDVCDPDDDDDGVLDLDDNCPFVANTEQIDLDQDGQGYACEQDIALCTFRPEIEQRVTDLGLNFFARNILRGLIRTACWQCTNGLKWGAELSLRGFNDLLDGHNYVDQTEKEELMVLVELLRAGVETDKVDCSNRGRFGDATIAEQFMAGEEVSAYPNPTADQLYFSELLSRVEVYNALGLLVQSASEVTTIDLRELTPAIYVVKTQNRSGHAKAFQIVKE